MMQLISPLSATEAELNNAAAAGQNFGIQLGAAISSVAHVVGVLAATFTVIGTAIGTAVAVGVVAFSRLYAAGKSLVSGFMTIGSQIMSGLMNGLNAGYARVKAKILSIGNSIKSAFKGALGIQSPSRVFMKYGNFINQGLEQGLVKSKNKPISETKKIADVISKGFLINAVVGINNKKSLFNDTIGTRTNKLSKPFINDTINTDDEWNLKPNFTDNTASSVVPFNLNITINQIAGENTEDLVDRVVEKIKQEKDLMQRGRLHD